MRPARASAVVPCEKSITCAISSRSGATTAMARKSCLRLSGRLGGRRTRVHRHEDADVGGELDALADQLDHLGAALEPLLDDQDLLRDGGEDALLEAVELVEQPRARLARPTKRRPIAWKSKFSSQLKTRTKRPSCAPAP